MSEIASAIQFAARREATDAGRTMQLAVVVDSNPLTLELMESRFSVHKEELILSQAAQRYDDDDGIEEDDVVVVLRKKQNGAVVWIVLDVVSDNTPSGTAALGSRVTDAESAISASSARIGAVEPTSFDLLPLTAPYVSYEPGEATWGRPRIIRQGRLVKLSGLVRNVTAAAAIGTATNTTIASGIPAAHRPSRREMFSPVAGIDSLGQHVTLRIDITPAGQLVIMNVTSAWNGLLDYLSLGLISWVSAS